MAELCSCYKTAKSGNGTKIYLMKTDAQLNPAKSQERKTVIL